MELTWEEVTSQLDEMHYQLDGWMTPEQYAEWQAYEHDKRWDDELPF